MMNKISLLTGGCLLMLFAVTGCYYDKADQVYPQAVCDTTREIKLSVQIDSLLQLHCYSCHSGSADNGGGIPFDVYEVLQAYAENGVLLSAINQDGKATSNYMPKNAAKMSDCEIAMFRIWIESGAPNN